jgi:hypothetical protein
MTHQRIVRGIAQAQTEELDFDGMGVLKDDDDESKSKPGEIAQVEPINLDFNLLSRVLADIRPKETFGYPQIGLALSGMLVLIGLICFAFSYRSSLRRVAGIARD